MFTHRVPLWQYWSEQVLALLTGHYPEVFGHIPCGVCHPLLSCTMSPGTDPPLSLEGHSWLYRQIEKKWHTITRCYASNVSSYFDFFNENCMSCLCWVISHCQGDKMNNNVSLISNQYYWQTQLILIENKWKASLLWCPLKSWPGLLCLWLASTCWGDKYSILNLTILVRQWY